MKSGDYATACPNLAESQRLDPSPGTLLNLAICEERLGNLATAWAKYQELVDTIPKGDSRVAIARKVIADLEPKLPRLRITIAGTPANSTVTLDGVELRAASLGTYIPIDPGAHVVTVSTPGRETSEKPIRIEVAERMDVELSAGESSPVPSAAPQKAYESPPTPDIARRPSPPPRHPHHSEDASRLRTASYIAGGVGVAGFVAAGVLAAAGLQEKETIDAHCTGRRCDNEGFQAAERGSQLLQLADVALVVGISGATAFGVLLWQASQAEVRLERVAGGASLTYSAALP
jgi:hypothetical protein